MADQDPSAGQPPAEGDEPKKSPPRPPARPPGEAPVTLTRQRLGTGRGGAPAAKPAGEAAPPPAEPAQQPAASPEQPAAAATPAQQPAARAEQPASPPAPRPAVEQPATTAQPVSRREAAETQLAAESGTEAVEAGDVPVSAPAAGPAARPAPPAGEGDGRPAPPARPAPAASEVGAGAPAAGAAAARAGARAAVAERLSEAVKKEPAGSGGGQAQGLVYVWPHLVTIEFLSALLLLLSMIVLSWLVNAPLEAHANLDRTPNPSKAPWYFLNLQELLLHMHPALAGVIVPSAALGAIAAIPFFDRDQSDAGKWFGTAKAIPIAVFTAVYTLIVEVTLIFFDELIGVKPMMAMLANATGIGYLKEQTPLGMALFSMPDVIVPTLLMLGPILPLMILILKIYKPNTREVMVALFTGFVVSYVVLTISGTFFRGQGMHLCWLTDPCQIRIE